MILRNLFESHFHKSVITVIAMISILIIMISSPTLAQFQKGTPQYQQQLLQQGEILREQVTSNPDVNLYYHPERKYKFNDGFSYDYPKPEYYRISLLMDPCRFNPYNCCVNVFGSPEYPAMKIASWEQERVFKPLFLGNDTEIAANVNVVDEDGMVLSDTSLRSADDDAIIDKDCVKKGEPYSYCMGKNYAMVRSRWRPACFDNNVTLDTLQGCYHTNGTRQERCVQVAYSQNAFVAQCGPANPSDPSSPPDDHCGTFIEVHMSNGSPYNDRYDVISSARVPNRTTSGYSTVVVPLTWGGNTSRVLCSYTESFLRVGAPVYIRANAPVCCCMKPFKPATRVGSFFCPISANGRGPFAAQLNSLSDAIVSNELLLEYPFCPNELSGVDRVMCSVYDAKNRRHFSRNCSDIEWINPDDKINRPFYSSKDMDGKEYHGVCPYFPSCALTLDAGKCKKQDYRFTFIGKVGIVTAIDNLQEIPKVWVSFNDGRTSYEFDQEMVKLELTKSMYELWWVVRSHSEFVIQKRKGFNVTYPLCTFDLTNNRFFPFAQIDNNGKPIDSSLI